VVDHVQFEPVAPTGGVQFKAVLPAGGALLSLGTQQVMIGIEMARKENLCPLSAPRPHFCTYPCPCLHCTATPTFLEFEPQKQIPLRSFI